MQRDLGKHRQGHVEVEAERAEDEREPDHRQHPRLAAHVRQPFARAGEDAGPLELLDREEVPRSHQEQAGENGNEADRVDEEAHAHAGEAEQDARHGGPEDA